MRRQRRGTPRSAVRSNEYTLACFINCFHDGVMRLRTLLVGAAGGVLAIGIVATSALGVGARFGLPDPSRTPGATSSAVGQGNIHSTICVSGYTKTVRPPASYTNNLKKQQLASGYAVGGRTSPKVYEEDHLVPLEVGGNPTDHANLWPEPRWGRWTASVKDRLENKAHRLVCGGTLSLADAQAMVTGNWETAYKSYFGTPPPPTTTTTTPPTTTSSSPPPPTCYPKTSGGNCYRIGEYCPLADHGMTGLSSNLTPMICRQVGSRWRWEAS